MALYKYIAIEGNIGAGKTTLSTRIAQSLNAKLILEQFADNPFLPKFYKQPERYAFPLEMSFLTERYKQLKDLLNTQDLFHTYTVADYLIHKCKLFAKVNLAVDEFYLFETVYDIIYPNLPEPDIILFLYCSIDQLHQNIKKRARSYEQEIPSEYLQKIQESYQQFIRAASVPVLMIDSSSIDFFDDEELKKVLNLLEQKWDVGIHYIDFTA